MLSTLVASFLVCVTGFQTGSNLVPNGSFTAGSTVPDGWTSITQTSGTVTATRDTTTFVSAPAALQLSTGSAAGEGNVAANLPELGGKALEISGKIRSSGPGVQEAQVAFFAQDSDYKFVVWKPVASRYDFKDGQWSTFSTTYTPPANAKRCFLIVYIKGTGKVWLDDASILDVTRPPDPTGTKSNLIEILPVTNQILAVRFRDGTVTHHRMGQKRTDETVNEEPLDIATAMMPRTYGLLSENDPNYRSLVRPVTVGRKSKGVDFGWITDRWVGDHVENDRPDHVKEHWVYLNLPTPLKEGAKYAISTGPLAKNSTSTSFIFSSKSRRSDSVHVNIVGYAPSAPAKFGYVYQWLGNQGGLDLHSWIGKKFWLINQTTKLPDFEGVVAFRKPKSTAETGQQNQTPGDNFQQADVYECDFSAFTKPGKFVLAVEGIGTSFPFEVGDDVYRQAFRTTVRGLYHNRSGIALTKPYTDWERPAPHNTRLTPGFAGKLKYTSSRTLDWRNADADIADKPAIEAGIKGPIDVAGWYQDAGDWDGYSGHMNVAYELLLAYQMAPENYAAGELNIPESTNGLPDILNEAGWLPRFGARLRKALLAKGYGTGGVGLRVCGDHFGSDTGPNGVGRGSWLDVDRTWIISGEDPLSTYTYAGAAAQMATCLSIAKKSDPERIDWIREARESYDWAKRNTRPGDLANAEVIEQRARASAALFVLTGERAYEEQLNADTGALTTSSDLWNSAIYGPAIYALGKGPAVPNADLLARLTGALLHTADSAVNSAEKRALRWGGDWYFPTVIGHLTTPMVQSLGIAATLTKSSDPTRSRKYRGVAYTTCDYFLGTNPLNQTWVTGLGAQSPVGIFHMDSWYSGNSKPIPGIIPYGPWRIDRATGQGPWDKDWANKSLFPGAYEWPTAERWCNNRCAPMSGEFTIWQNTAPAAALFGFLCAPKK